jgi:hypothetical protein
MADISKHHTEEEWECRDRENCRVHFLIPWNAVSVDNFLEREGEIVEVEVGRGLLRK